MIAKFLRRLLAAVLLVLLQVLLLNRINIAGYVTPFLFIYFILILDSSVSPIERMIWGFCIGLVVDVFSSTPGMHAASTTLMAYAQPSLLRLFFVFDRRDRINPGFESMGVRPFLSYIFFGTLLHHAVFFMLKTFSFAQPLALLLTVLFSTLFTVLLMVLTELLLRRKRRRRR